MQRKDMLKRRIVMKDINAKKYIMILKLLNRSQRGNRSCFKKRN